MNHSITIPAGINRLAVIKAFIVFLWNLPDGKAFDVVVTRHTKKRTNKQNAAFHAYFSLLAETLNNAGLDKRTVFNQMKESFTIQWSEHSVKEDLWRPVQLSQIGEASTTKLTTEQVNEVYRPLDAWLLSELGIDVPFPSIR